MPEDRMPSLPKMPKARARRVSLFEREVHIGLSAAAIELLFARAKTNSNGQANGNSFSGTTSIKVDMTELSDAVTDTANPALARRVCDLVSRDPQVRSRVLAIAQREATNLAGEELHRFQTELDIRVDGTSLYIDTQTAALRALGVGQMELL